MGRKPEGTAEKLFKDFGKKVDGWIQEIKEVKDQAEDKYADRIEELKRNGETLKEEFDQFKERHKDDIDNIESKFRKAGDELSDVFKRTFGR